MSLIFYQIVYELCAFTDNCYSTLTLNLTPVSQKMKNESACFGAVHTTSLCSHVDQSQTANTIYTHVGNSGKVAVSAVQDEL